MSLYVKCETKIDSEPCLVVWNDTLFVGTDSGSIHTFDENLSLGVSWSAHEVQLFALAAKDDKVYSASNDGGVRVWTSKGEKLSELPSPDADIGSICAFGKYLYVGDEVGSIYVFEDNTLKAKYSVLEEVKALQLCPPFMFTARDLYVTVTEIKPDVSKDRFVTQHVMEGRAPLTINGSWLLVTGRGGNNVQLHNNSLETKFKKLHEVKASDMILTCVSASGDFVWTGGWDCCVRRWKIADDQLHPNGEINLGSCVNSLVATSGDNVYAILGDKRIVNIKTP